MSLPPLIPMVPAEASGARLTIMPASSAPATRVPRSELTSFRGIGGLYLFIVSSNQVLKVVSRSDRVDTAGMSGLTIRVLVGSQRDRRKLPVYFNKRKSEEKVRCCQFSFAGCAEAAGNFSKFSINSW